MAQTQLADPNEEKFCMLYVNAPAPYAGNAVRCFDVVFGNNGTGEIDVVTALAANEFLKQERISARIRELEEQNVINVSSLRPRLTQTLLKIADECSTAVYFDRWGIKLSPAPLRAVSVNAIKTLNDMYGIKEDIAHKVSLEGADGKGVTINILAPQKKDDSHSLEMLEEDNLLEC